MAAVSALIYRRKGSSRAGPRKNSYTWPGRDERKLSGRNADSLHELPQLRTTESTAELSSNSPHELPQLVALESAVELPAGYVFHEEIGRAI